MSDEDGNFFARWSRRKGQVREGQLLPPEPVQAPVAVVAPVLVQAAAPVPVPVETEAPPPPTLEDTHSLTPASDFSRFVAQGVSPEVRNAAVKKLFADPHFNLMDGLDTYIDDYAQPSPLSAADMAKMVSAQFLKLVDDPEEQEKKKIAAAAQATPQEGAAQPDEPAPEQDRAPDAAEPQETPHDDHADLQLQPDHAPGPQGPGPGAG